MSEPRRRVKSAAPNTLTLDGRDLAGDWVDEHGRNYFVAVVWEHCVIICYRQPFSILPWPIMVIDGDFGEGKRFRRPAATTNEGVRE